MLSQRYLYEKTLSATDSLLQHHRISGSPVLPAALQIEMALVGILGGNPFAPVELGGVRFLSFFPVATTGVLQLSVEQDATSTAFELRGKTDASPDAKLLASGWGRLLDETHHHESAWQVEAPTPQSVTAIYERFAGRGIEYGDSYRTLRALTSGAGTLEATLHVPPSQDGWYLHPLLMDGLFQAMSCALQSPFTPNTLDTTVPIGIEHLYLYSPLPATVVLRARRTERQGDLLKGDAVLLAEDGTVCAVVQGIRMKLNSTHQAKNTAPRVLSREVRWRPAAVVQSRALPIGTWVVFTDREGIGTDMVARLRRAGNRVVAVEEGNTFRALGEEHWELPPTQADAYPALWDAIGVPVTGILHLWGCNGRSSVRNMTDLEWRLGHGVYSILHLVQSLSQRLRQCELWLVTTRGQPVNKASAKLSPGKAAIWGLGRVIRTEHPGYNVRLVDLDGEVLPRQAELLWQELHSGDDTPEVGYREDNRHSPYLVRAQSGSDVPVIRPGGCYLIIGGQGGIGWELATYLAEAGAGSLVLMNRSAIAEDDPRHTRVAELEARGTQVWLAQGDVTDPDALGAVLDEAARRYGMVNGVIHAGGVLRDGLIRSTTAAEVSTVLLPKVHGTWVLDQALTGRNVDFVVLFGSVSGVYGNVGQGAYAAANSYLDAFAHLRRVAGGAPWTSIDWGLWGDVGMGVDVVKQLARRGIRPLTTAEALAEIMPALAAGTPQRIVAHPNPNEVIEEEETDAPYPVATPISVAATPTPATTPSNGTRRQQVVEYLQQRLGVPTLEGDVPFLEYGVDSILSVEMAQDLSDRWDVSLPATLFLEYATLDELVAGLQSHYGLTEGAASPATTTAPVVTPIATVAMSIASDRSSTPSDAVAIVAASGRFPGAPTLEAFWELVREGRSAIREIPEQRWDVNAHYEANATPSQGTYCRWGGFLEDIESFDPTFFRIAPREARRLDPQQRLILEEAWAVLEAAGMVGERQIGVFVAATYTHYRDHLGLEDVDPYTALGSMNALLANRISYAFDLQGPSLTIDTLCSSSLVAIHHAVASLQRGDCRAALVAGVQVGLTPWYYRSLSQLGALSPSGECHPFDADANGFIPGEGVAAILLKPLADAQRDGDTIWGVIRGSAVNHGGRASGITVPRKNAQVEVVSNALRTADLPAHSISYLEAHGTGTSLGDPIELDALALAFGQKTDQRQFCALGAVKANIGHLEPAAGLAGLIKVLLALRHREIPPLANFDQPNQHIHFADSPFFVPVTAQPWRNGTYPRRAGISAFGMGGTNAHLIVEEAPHDGASTPPAAIENQGAYVLALSAHTPDALRIRLTDVLEWIESATASPDALTYSLNVGRGQFKHRVAIVGQSRADLIQGIRRALDEADLDTPFVVANGDRLLPTEYPISRELARVVARYTTLTPDEINDVIYLAERDFATPALAQRAALAQLYVNGVEVEWATLYQNKQVQRVLVPAYPFPSKRAASIPAPAADHVQDLQARLATVITHHRVNGTATVPAAAILAAAVEVAGREGIGEPLQVEEMVFLQGLNEKDNPFAFETAVNPQGVRFTLTRESQRVLQGRVHSITTPAPAGLMPATLHYLCPEQVSPDALYDWYRSRGMEYGAPLRVINALWRGTDMVVAELSPNVGKDMSPIARMAVVLDGAFQTMAALTMANPAIQEHAYRPFSVQGVSFWHSLEDVRYAFLRLLPEVSNEVARHGEVLLLNGEGKILVRCERVIYRGAPRGDAPLHRAAPAPKQVASTTPPTPQRQQADAHRHQQAMEAEVVRHVCEVLEISHTITAQTPFAELGLDSILATTLAGRLEEQFDVPVSPTTILDQPTPRAVVKVLIAQGARVTVSVTEPPPEAPVAPPPPTPVYTTISVTEPPIVEDEDLPAHAIAIVGMACHFPDCDSPEAFWELLRDGRNAVKEVPSDRWNVEDYFHPNPKNKGTTYARHGGFIRDIDNFDARFFGLYPRQVEAMDPQHRWLLRTTWEALENAGYAGEAWGGTPTGVFVGASYQHYRDYNIGARLDTYSGLGNQNGLLANRISYFFDFKGPCMTVDTLCSSSLVALHTALRSLHHGDCQQAIVAGVQLGISPWHFISMSSLRTLSTQGRCRTFDATADGIALGEGIGVVVLKPLARALADGDHIHAVIRGSAVNHSGRTSGFTVPSSSAQRDVIAEALLHANISADTLGYVEAHGTGTALGDPIEVEGLTDAFRTTTARRQYCAIGSVKTNIGHLEPAAGMASLFKCVLAMQQGAIPPHLHLEQTNALISFEETPFYLTPTLLPWQRGTTPRRAAISAFGLGGVNAHLVLEEAPPSAPRPVPHASPLALLRVAGATPDAVRQLAASYATALVTLDKEDVCYTAAVGRAVFAHESVVTGRDTADLIQGLRDLADSTGIIPARRPVRNVFWFGESLVRDNALLTSLHKALPLVQTICARIAALTGNGPIETWSDSLRGFALGYAVSEVLTAWGVRPDALGGEGVGEIVAVCVADALSLESAVVLVDHLATGDVHRLRQVVTTLSTAQPVVSLYRRATQAPSLLEGVLELAQPVFETTDDDVCWQIGTLPTALAPYMPTLPVLEPFADVETNLRTAVAAYVGQQGGTVAWDVLTPVSRRVPLPTYPFQQERYWRTHVADLIETIPFVTALPEAEATDGENATQTLWKKQWRRTASPVTMPLVRGSKIILFQSEDDALTTTLLASLDAQGVTPMRFRKGNGWVQQATDLWQMNPALPDDWDRFDHLIATYPGQWSGVIDLWNTDPALSSDDPLLTMQQEAERIRRVVATFAASATPTPVRWLWATQGAEAHAAHEQPPLNPTRAALAQAVRVVGHEHKGLSVATIELRSLDPRVDATVLIEEFMGVGGANEILRHGTERWVAHLDACHLPAADPTTLPLRSDKVYLVTGGASGVGAQLAETLVRFGAKRLVLCGRSPLPPRTQWEHLPSSHADHAKVAVLRFLVAAGASVTYLTCDVGNRESVRRLVAEVRTTLGPLAGIIHAAGVAGAFGSLLRHDWAQYAKTLTPKVEGSRWLAEACAGDSLDFFVMVSSLAGIAAAEGRGLADYAIANRYQWALAEHLRATTGVSASAHAWGEWQDTGLAKGLTQKTNGTVAPLTPATAQRLFSTALLYGAGNYVLVNATEGQSLDALVAAPTLHVTAVPPLPSAAPPFTVRTVIEATPVVAPSTPPIEHMPQVKTLLEQALRDTLKAPALTVDWARPLAQLGLDSLTIADVTTRLEKSYGTSLDPSLFLSQPTLQLLAQTLLDHYGPPRTVDRTAVAHVVAEPHTTTPSPVAELTEPSAHAVATTADDDLRTMLRALRGGTLTVKNVATRLASTTNDTH